MSAESSELQSLLQALMHPGLKSIDLSLGRMQRYLQAHDNPQKRLAPVVHLAGTNGKGSTQAFLRSILEAAGYRWHAFTSPHLVHFSERVMVAGRALDEPELIRRLEAIKARTQSHPLTFFEANAALAFELFAEHSADCVLLEVGMGGRFDATNVIDLPAVTIITPIGMDHQEYLGDTLEEIAYEKAGVIKTGVPVVLAPQAVQAVQVIRRVAKREGAPVIEVAVQRYDAIGLHGEHQHMNGSVAATAARCLREQGFENIDESAIAKGIANAHWPGRLQHLSRGALVDSAPPGCELWLDGGHNAQAAQMLAVWARAQEKPVHLICAMSQDKDANAFLSTLQPAVSRTLCVQIDGEPLLQKAQELAGHAPENVTICDDLQQAVSLLPADSIGLIAGSLYLAGYVLQKNG